MNEKETLPLPRPKRRWFRSFLLGLVILLSGILLGSGLTVKFLLRQIQRPELVTERMIGKMKSKLDLTDEQVLRIERIFAQSKDYFTDLRSELRPLVQEEFQRIQAEVSQVLTPEQIIEWNHWFEIRKQFWLQHIALKEETAAASSPIRASTESIDRPPASTE